MGPKPAKRAKRAKRAAAAEEAPPEVEPAVEVEVEATSHGLLLKKMRAPIRRAWRVLLTI